jgi:DNA-binding NarL/FixJ family response regulator
METIQLAIRDRPYAAALREALLRNGPWQVRCVDLPNPEQDGVIVLDTVTLEQMGQPIANPERVVLITRNDPAHLSDAWDAGVLSVVFEKDPVSTAMLAIMSARLRVPRQKPSQAGTKTASSASSDFAPAQDPKPGHERP